MRKGETYRIVTDDTEMFYGLNVGNTFTITNVCMKGFGWCDPSDKMDACWSTFRSICILDEQMIVNGDVELVNA